MRVASVGTLVASGWMRVASEMAVEDNVVWRSVVEKWSSAPQMIGTFGPQLIVTVEGGKKASFVKENKKEKIQDKI